MGVVTGHPADIKAIMENHGVPASLPKRKLETIPEQQSGVDKRVLDLVQEHGVASLDELKPEKLKLVKDFVDAIVTAITEKHNSKYAVRMLQLKSLLFLPLPFLNTYCESPIEFTTSVKTVKVTS